MATLNKTDIKAKVRLMLDEQGVNEGEFAEVAANQGERDESYLDNIIENKAEEAAQFVYLNADASLMPWQNATGTAAVTDVVTSFNVSSAYASGPDVYQLTLSPSGVWRWKSVGIGGWSRMVSREEAIDEESPEFAMLSDKYCTGTPERPRVGIRKGTNEADILMLYSTPHVTPLEKDFRLLYVSKPVFVTTTESQTTTTLTIGDRLVDAFYYYLAGLTCMVLGDDRQEGFFQQAAELMGKTVNNEQ